jgi:U32 family peptidase
MQRPEILAPAGSREALQAALAAGADAVYFGLDEGFNARARASNFPIAGLPDIVSEIHRAHARAYLALNTLVFESELAALEKIVRAAAQAGVDALIVQDPAVCRIARQLCPAMEIHASTQMTISSTEGAEFAERLGVTRVVLPRELSLDEIGKFAAKSSMEIEVFIAGALCMSWSGQCLSSEAWGGRSANRGQCAQACRHPYDLIVDGQQRPMGEVSYLLSPQDLGGFSAIQELVRLGVHTLKIEGRQKDAEYVFQAVTAIREWVDSVMAGLTDDPATRQRLSERIRDLSLTYSRGLSEGFFHGSDHQTLVEGRVPRHRGVLLGRIDSLQGKHVWVKAAEPTADVASLQPCAGMGVVFRGARPVAQEDEQGGPLFAVDPAPGGWRLTFGRPGPDLRRVVPGDEVWVTGSPQLRHRHDPQALLGRWPVRLRVSGQAGDLLRVEASWDRGQSATSSSEPLQEARKGGLDETLLREKLGGWGGGPFQLESLDCSALGPGLFVPVSQLKALRQQLQAELEQQLRSGSVRTLSPAAVLSNLRRNVAQTAPMQPTEAFLEPLVRTAEQLEAVIEAGLPGVTLDWMELIGLNGAVERARSAGLKVGLATVRVQKPGEESYDRRLQALRPDWVLARHWGAVMHFSRGEHRPAAVHGDFSLNVTNSVTAAELIQLGLDSVTVAHDLDQTQLQALLAVFPASRLAVTLHHHIATFHTEHCVYSHLLSTGRDYRTCGRPCEKHLVELQDRKNIRHPVIVDVGCRNTVFNGMAQSCARLVPQLLSAGVRRFRLEFVRESGAETRTVLQAYADLLAGRISATEAQARVGAHEQFGVSLGTMAVLS